MAARRREPPTDPPEPSWLEEALPGVRPLAGRDKTAPPPESPTQVRRRSEPVRFQRVRDEGDRLEGLAPGVDRRQLRRLRRDEVAAELEIDLHGLRREDARQALQEALAQAIRQGVRCVLVVHGRGQHSPAEPVLRAALVEWLAEPPHGPSVMAFASSAKLAGGATYVLLRRPR